MIDCPKCIPGYMLINDMFGQCPVLKCTECYNEIILDSYEGECLLAGEKYARDLAKELNEVQPMPKGLLK